MDTVTTALYEQVAEFQRPGWAKEIIDGRLRVTMPHDDYALWNTSLHWSPTLVIVDDVPYERAGSTWSGPDEKGGALDYYSVLGWRKLAEKYGPITEHVILHSNIDLTPYLGS